MVILNIMRESTLLHSIFEKWSMLIEDPQEFKSLRRDFLGAMASSHMDSAVAREMVKLTYEEEHK